MDSGAACAGSVPFGWEVIGAETVLVTAGLCGCVVSVTGCSTVAGGVPAGLGLVNAEFSGAGFGLAGTVLLGGTAPFCVAEAV